MKIKVLGCHGGVAPGFRPASFLINQKMLLEAGSVASALSPLEQAKIRNILVTHTHIDHVKDICFFCENIFGLARHSVNIVSSEAILNLLHEHLLNDVIWPDFSKICAVGNTPLIRFKSLKRKSKVGGISVSCYPVNHSAGAVGFILETPTASVLFTGDTGPTKLIWDEANKRKNLKAIFTEVSFPNSLADLARVSQHFCPATFKKELKKIKNRDIPIFIYHIKPHYFHAVVKEIRDIRDGRLRLLEQEDELVF